jgi:hypothetical protein
LLNSYGVTNDHAYVPLVLSSFMTNHRLCN